MDQFRAMRVFERVAERGSLAAASEDLGYARGAASAIVADLERYLGVQLLERTTRRLRLTEEGEHYLARARAILADLAQLEEEVGGAERQPRGFLRVQIPAGLARMVVGPAIGRFSAMHPLIEVEIVSGNGVPDFVGARIDAAVTVGPLPELDVVARRLGGIPVLTVAAPSYVALHGAPQTPAELPQHQTIRILASATRRHAPWQFRDAGRDIALTPPGRLTFEAAEAAVACAVTGAGLLQLASYLVFDEIRAGRLVEVLDRFRPTPPAVHIVHPRHRLKPRKLRAFEEFLIDLDRRMRRKWAPRPAPPLPLPPHAPAQHDQSGATA